MCIDIMYKHDLNIATIITNGIINVALSLLKSSTTCRIPAIS